jgi:hypothetical protein
LQTFSTSDGHSAIFSVSWFTLSAMPLTAAVCTFASVCSPSMLVLMVGYTMLSLWIVAQPIVA